jgi:hypothetical protein
MRTIWHVRGLGVALHNVKSHVPNANRNFQIYIDLIINYYELWSHLKYIRVNNYSDLIILDVINSVATI